MPDFDPSKLSPSERAAWIERLKGDGPNEVAGLFETQLRAVSMLREEGKSPAEIAALIMGSTWSATQVMRILNRASRQSV
jgi:hypothetical protein